MTVGLIRAASVKGLGGIAAVVEGDVRLAGQHPSHGLADHRLVIDQEDGDLVLCQEGLGAHSRPPGGLTSLGPVVPNWLYLPSFQNGVGCACA